MQAEIDGCEYRQRAETPDEELADVESGDVLDDHAAHADQLAIEHCELHPDDQIARCAIGGAQRAAAVACDDSADRCVCMERGIERDHLTVPGEGRLEIGPARAGFHADCEIGGFIGQNAVELRGGESETGFAGRAAHQALGRVAGDGDRA